MAKFLDIFTERHPSRTDATTAAMNILAENSLAVIDAGPQRSYRGPSKRAGLALTGSSEEPVLVLHAVDKKAASYHRISDLADSKKLDVVTAAIPEGYTSVEKQPPRKESIERIVRPGASISHGDGPAGTLGCFVTLNNSEGGIGVTGACHVLGYFGVGQIGHDVFTPAVEDMPDPDAPRATDIIGKIVELVPLRSYDRPRYLNKTDIAVIELSQPEDRLEEGNIVYTAANEPIELAYNPDKAVVFESLGKTVFKTGRSSGVTSGTVSYLALTPCALRHTSVRKGTKHIYIYEDLFIVKSATSEPFSLPGDSGAAVYLTDGTLLGFVVGGSGTHTYVSVVHNAFEAMNVELYRG